MSVLVCTCDCDKMVYLDNSWRCAECGQLKVLDGPDGRCKRCEDVLSILFSALTNEGVFVALQNIYEVRGLLPHRLKEEE